MPLYKDQLGREVQISHFPQRIISVVPSQTELLFDLGLDTEVVGITKFCIHPDSWFKNKIRVGGTKNLSIEKIRSLQPDLIIANKEENVQSQIEELATLFPVWISDINHLPDALKMIKDIGVITQKDMKANDIANSIEMEFNQLASLKSNVPTAYLIWRDPYMTVGGDTFIHDMLSQCGLRNIFEQRIRYPTITIEELKNKDCKLLILSSEPYPFKQQHIDELQQQLPYTKIILVDGEMFSWYGSRLLQSPEYFSQLQDQIHSIV
jgi:ABC-type Fe3+-hydroxamate transport system substrate-binding protein